MGINPWDAIPPRQRALMAAQEAAEARQEAAERAERADREQMAARMAQVAENSFQYCYGHSSAEYRAAAMQMAEVREGRDPAAPYGSVNRAAILIDGRELAPREAGATVGRTADERLLGRARQAGQDPFMRRMVGEFDRRRGGKHVISRAGTAEHVECVECDAEGLTEAESFEVHYNPRFGDPLPPTTVPDYAPSRSKRLRSGTGWPGELVR